MTTQFHTCPRNLLKLTENDTLSGLHFKDLFELFCWFCYQTLHQTIEEFGSELKRDVQVLEIVILFTNEPANGDYRTLNGFRATMVPLVESHYAMYLEFFFSADKFFR